MSASKQAAARGRHLRLVRRGNGAGGRTVYAAVLGIVWLAIVWLVFVSFVDSGRDDRTTPPTKTQLSRSNAPQNVPSSRPASTSGG